MGERTTGLDDPEYIELQIAALRRNLSGIVRELDHRRHDLVDWRAQIQKHKPELAVAGGGLLLVAGGFAVAGLVMARRNRRLDVRVKKIGRALSDPATFKRPPSLLARLGVALAAAVVGAAAKSILGAVVAPRRLPAASRGALPAASSGWNALNP